MKQSLATVWLQNLGYFFPHCEMPFGTGKKKIPNQPNSNKNKLEKTVTFSKAPK